MSSLPVLCELSIPYLKLDGLFIAMKADCEEELKKSSNILNQLDSKVINVIKFNLPIESSNRSLVIIKKLKKTKAKYPRRYDKIVKSK